MDADVIVVGAGLAGLVAAAELADAGRRVIILDQEPEASLGGQAFWSFGGLFFVDSPEQRRLRIRDSRDLALQDWIGLGRLRPRGGSLAAPVGRGLRRFRRGREARRGCRQQGLRIFPIVGWAERGGYLAHRSRQFGAALSRHVGHRARRDRAVRAARARGGAKGLVTFRFRHRVNALTENRRRGRWRAGRRAGAEQRRSAGTASSRRLVGRFALRAQAVIVTSGGIGGNHDLVRRFWPKRLGAPPRHMISGVPEHVDGLMLDVVRASGGTHHQLRPHVALPGRHPELRADLEPRTASAS